MTAPDTGASSAHAPYEHTSHGEGRGLADAWSAALEWRRDGAEVAVAVVFAARGSTPRGLGSALAVRADGVFSGSVSGGCAEAAAIRVALGVIASGQSRLLDVQDEGVELACGGALELLVAPAPSLATLEAIAERRARREPVVLGFRSDGAPAELLDAGGSDRDLVHAAAMRGAAHRDGERLITPLMPARRLVVIGAVHITRALVGLAAAVGLELVVVEPRQAFHRSAERWAEPPPNLLGDWPEVALRRLGLDTSTAVVALTHDAKFDDEALRCAAASPAFYVGALGSRRTAAARLERLAAQGLCGACLRRIAGPVGLAIGAESPEEIALSIVAELVSASRGSRVERPLPEGLLARVSVGAVVLAAGRSSRLREQGAPKPALELGGAPMLEAALEVARQAVDGPVVVTTAERAGFASLERRSGIEHVHDPSLSQAMSASLAAGVARLRGRVDAALVFLADMPFIRLETAQAIAARFAEEPSLAAVVPVHDGRRGHPVLFADSAFERLLALHGDVGGRAVLEALGDRVAEVEVHDAGVHFDVDTPEALAHARASPIPSRS